MLWRPATDQSVFAIQYWKIEIRSITSGAMNSQVAPGISTGSSSCSSPTSSAVSRKKAITSTGRIRPAESTYVIFTSRVR